MSDSNFDQALIDAAFRLAAEAGWTGFTIADAARAADLSLAEARVRFPGKHVLLRRYGQRLDQAALATSPGDGSVRDRLFDLLMSRFDAMKPHREGVRALLRHLPADPPTAVQLACGTRRGMRWMLNAAGQPTNGIRGHLRIQGLVAVWTWAFRAFESDESEDLSATMAALDTALGHAESLARWISGDRPRDTDEDASAVPGAEEPLT